MKWPVLYRDFEINPDENWGFMWSHKDYDGPEDNRIGTGDTVGDCKVQIDEWHENEAELAARENEAELTELRRLASYVVADCESFYHHDHQHDEDEPCPLLREFKHLLSPPPALREKYGFRYPRADEEPAS